MIDSTCPTAQNVAAYLEKYKTEIADINMTSESFSSEYSLAIRIQPTNLRGWE
jgi:hypothetical protein